MGNNLRVDVAHLRAVAPRFNDLSMRVSDLESELKASLSEQGECWGGDETGEAFFSGYRPARDLGLEYLPHAAKALMGIGNRLTAAADGYEDTDSSTTNELEKTDCGTGGGGTGGGAGGGTGSGGTGGGGTTAPATTASSTNSSTNPLSQLQDLAQNFGSLAGLGESLTSSIGGLSGLMEKIGAAVEPLLEQVRTCIDDALSGGSGDEDADEEGADGDGGGRKEVTVEIGEQKFTLSVGNDGAEVTMTNPDGEVTNFSVKVGPDGTPEIADCADTDAGASTTPDAASASTETPTPEAGTAGGASGGMASGGAGGQQMPNPAGSSRGRANGSAAGDVAEQQDAPGTDDEDSGVTLAEAGPL